MSKLAACLAVVALGLLGCSTLSPRRDRGEKPIEIIAAGKQPTKPFTKVGRLDFHVEKPSRGAPTMDEFRPELEDRARLAGADAVTDVDWELKGSEDAGIYHVTATAITYRVAREPATPLAAAHSHVPAGEVEILADAPARPFKKVSNLELYVEKKGPGEPSFADVAPELKRQARLSGADAVTNVEWNVGGTTDAPVYHVTAVGIAYNAPSDGSAAPADGAKK